MPRRNGLSAKQYLAIQMYVYENATGRQVAEACGVSENTVCAWNKTQEFQKELDTEIRRKFKKMALKATNKLDELIDCESPSIALGAVKETLSKAGFDPVQKVENTNTEIVVTVDDVDG